MVTVACTSEVPATVTDGSVRQTTLETTVRTRPQVLVLAVDDGDSDAARSLRAELAASMRAGALDDALRTPDPKLDLADWTPAEAILVLVEPTDPPILHAHAYRTARRTDVAHAAWVDEIASDVERWSGRRGRYTLLQSLRTTHDLLARLRPLRGDEEARIMVDAPRDAEIDAVAITSRDDESDGSVRAYGDDATVLSAGARVPRLSERGWVPTWSADDQLFDLASDTWLPLAPQLVASACAVHVYVPSLTACEPARGWQAPGPDTSAPLVSEPPAGGRCVVRLVPEAQRARCMHGDDVDQPGFCFVPSSYPGRSAHLRLTRDAAPLDVPFSRIILVCDRP